MEQRTHLKGMIGIAMLAMMFGSASVQAQPQTGRESSGMSPSGQDQSSPSSQPGQPYGSSGASSSSQDQSSPSSGNSSMGTSSQDESSQSSGSSSAGTSSSGAGSSSAASKDSSQKQLSRSDQNLIREMSNANLAEIEAGKMAQDKSQNEQVKNFAQRMVDDHTKAQDELKQLAEAKGMTLSSEPDAKHKASMKKLSALSGSKFDKQYMQQGGVRDHRQAHQLVQRAQSRASDPELKELAAKMEPTIQQHMTMAQELQSGKSSSSGSSGDAGSKDSGSKSGDSMSK